MIGSSSSSSDDDYDIPTEVAIIREIYDGVKPHEKFEMEFENALNAGCQMIVIEPSKLGDETSRWISVGNCLHKTAVLSGFGAIISSSLFHERPVLYIPFAAISTFCTGLYMISWQFDACCKYQIEVDIKKLSKLPLQTLSSMSPVVLVRKDDYRRKILHSSITLAAITFCSYRLYQFFR